MDNFWSGGFLFSICVVNVTVTIYFFQTTLPPPKKKERLEKKEHLTCLSRGVEKTEWGFLFLVKSYHTAVFTTLV